ncbi:mediator of RNA polymerase II transcription subunit 12 isoform X11 [Eurosta solidaginis]|uniref:mediator of RNA polymerase II transcription subunit 12 isoform X11 n=1 Tax=Eurosta solidaginis TaxID=178769 RepID=UPI0035309D84
MDLTLERENSALGSLFQQIINDLKNTSPLWEDFLTKATKLHQCLRAAIQAIAAYLDAFQKIADAATNSRGASKEIGTALTRVCLRHKAVESRLKTFTTAIMDCLVQPLQEKLEDWKRTVITIDKEHAKEYKRCRNELKKRSSDTLRLQKKARKGQSDTIQSLMDTHMQDVTLRRAELEDVEKKSLRSAMIEERLRYCTFVHMLQPVVKEECEVMSELGHLQEAMDSIAIVTKDPSILPQASEELIHDTKATMTLYPESPGGGSGSQGGCSNSLGSRKSSVCSISSMNSSGSSNSPGHHHYQRSLSQLISPAIRLKPGESSDSGFCSSPALTTQASTATSQSHAVSTWPPHCQDAVPVLPPAADRPHTISTAYEKGHQRPPLTVYTFQNPETILEGSGSIPGTPNGASSGANSGANTPSTQQKSLTGSLSRPPLPVRCSSLERPLPANNNRSTNNLLQRQCPSPIPAHITKELTAHHAQQQHIQQQQQQQQHLQQLSSPPTYVNMSELANMAAQKITANPQQQQRPVADLQQQHSIDSISSQFSNDSNASSGHHQTHEHQQQQQTAFADTNSVSKPRSHSVSSSSASSNTPSLHSHPSIESGTVTAPLVGQTPTPSSGSSTPQNHYSPLLTNSPSSTAAGTPSGGSMTSGMMSGFVYNVNSPTPPQSGTTSIDSDVLKITEIAGDHPINMPPTKEINSQLQQQELNNPNNASMGNITNDSQNIPTEITAQITTNTTNNKTFNEFDTESSNIVENDERSRASVLQKASMFEKQAAAAAAPTPIVVTGRSQTDAIYGTRRNAEDLHRATSTPANHYQQPPQQQHEQHSDQQDVGGVTRIARRSSVNTAKPPPPVRRSSSVTPSHNATSTGPTKPQLLQQQHATQQLQDAHGNKGNSLRTTPIKGVGQQTVSPSYTSPPPYDFQHNKIELPPPLPPPNPNQQRSRKQQQQQQVAADHQHTTTQITTTQITTTQQYDSQQQNRQYEELYDYLPSQQHLPASLKQQYKHQEQQQQQQQHLNLINDALTDHENEPPISYSDNGSFRTSSPGIYAQPKIVTSMSSFRSASPAANEHHNQHHHVIPPTQPKTNPNLIAQLSARLNKQNQQQQQHNSTSEGTYGSTPNSPNHHNHQHHQSEPEKFRNYTHPHQQQHQQQQQQQTSATNALAQQQQNYDAAQPSKHQQTGVAARHCITPTQSQQQQHHRELHHSCPPPLENPPPPPNSTTTVYAVTANAGSTTMPKNVSRGGGGNAATYAPPSGTMTLPKNLAQQRLQQQQHYQQQQQQQQQHFQQQQQHYQQQQYHHPTVTGANSGGQQHSQTASGNQRSQMPLPHHHQQQQQQMTYKQKSATLQSNHRQPPVPTRHSSVQQKIFVATNPFIQTTAIHCHSPASVQSQPASPTCSSPSSLASIYGTSSRHHHHHQQQQQQQQHQISAGSYGNGGGSGGNGGGHGYYAAPHNSTSYASSNIEKAGSIRSKTKAEFLENLNAKLAKQGLSGRAFAVRNLINSKALPDPRICHESLMDQIKRGATLKRNQKINDRSAPKIL